MVGEKAQPAVPYWRLSAFYFCFFGLLGALYPYWSLYLKSQGFSSADIGLLTGHSHGDQNCLPPNLWGWLADYTGKRLLIIRLGCLALIPLFYRTIYRPEILVNSISISGLQFFFGMPYCPNMKLSLSVFFANDRKPIVEFAYGDQSALSFSFWAVAFGLIPTIFKHCPSLA